MQETHEYAFVAVLAFVVGTASVVGANELASRVAITDPNSHNTAIVDDEGRLHVHVDGAGANPASIVNLFESVSDLVPGTCSEPGGLNYTVPLGKALLITDIVSPQDSGGTLTLWTDARGVLVRFANPGGTGNSFKNLLTPLVINAHETLCLSESFTTRDWFLSGRLVHAPTPRPMPEPPPPPGPEPKRGGEFRMRVSGDFAFNWDAYTAQGQFSVIVIQNLLNNLTHLHAVSSTIQPDLAESFEVSADGLTITYTVRDDVTWHDGTPFTAQDVRYSFERALNPPSGGTSVFVSRFSAITSVSAPDDETVIVILSRPSASLLTVISSPGFLIYPEHIPDIDAWKADPVGTGPFSFVQMNFGVDSDLDANHNYFKTDQAGRRLPFLQSVKHIKLSQDLAIAAFIAGGLSCACGYSSDILSSQVDDVRRDVADVIIGSTWSVNTIFMNSRPPLDDIRVRRAVHIGIDRREMLALISGDRAHYPPTYYLPTGLGGMWSLPDEDILQIPGFREPKQQDFDEAARLFSEAGVDPSSITLKFLGGQVQADLGEALVQLLLNIGLNVDVEFGGTAQLLQGDFDLALTGGGRTFDDAADQMTNYTRSTGPQNYGQFNNPRIDELLDAQGLPPSLDSPAGIHSSHRAGNWFTRCRVMSPRRGKACPELDEGLGWG